MLTLIKGALKGMVGLVLCLFVVWLGWPALIAFVLILLLAYTLHLLLEGEKMERPRVGGPRFFFILSLLLPAQIFVSWQAGAALFGEGLFGDIGKLLSEQSPRLMSSSLFVIVVAALIGMVVVWGIFVLLLLGVGITGAPLIYGTYAGYKGHKWEAVRSVMDSALELSKGIWQVKDGRAEVVNAQVGGLERFGGPATLLVQEGHAVILEKSGALSRVVGRGLSWLQPMERVAAVIELSSHSVSLELDNVITKDGAIIDKIQAWVFYRVVKGDPNRPGYQANGKYPFNEDMVYKLWDTAGSVTWQNAIKAIAQSSLRDVVARYTLDVILADSAQFRAKIKGDRREKLGSALFRGEFCEQINLTTKPFFGVEATAADIGHVEVPLEVKQRVRENWMTEWEAKIARNQKEAIITRGQADATTLMAQGLTRARAQEQMIAAIVRALADPAQPGVQPDIKQVIAMRLIEAWEKMASEHKGDIIMSNEFLAMLKSLVQ